MIDFKSSIGKVAVGVNGVDRTPRVLGTVIGYISRPTFILKDKHDKQHYVVDELVMLADSAQEVAFWKERAEALELQVANLAAGQGGGDER